MTNIANSQQNDISSDSSNESFLQRQRERNQKYETRSEPFKRFKFVTSELLAAFDEKSDTSSGNGILFTKLCILLLYKKIISTYINIYHL